jgi:hypothetical protein
MPVRLAAPGLHGYWRAVRTASRDRQDTAGPFGKMRPYLFTERAVVHVLSRWIQVAGGRTVLALLCDQAS